MHGKYAVIGFLLAGLAGLVFVLARAESRRSRPAPARIVEPAPEPVELTASREEIESAAAEARVLFRCAGDEFEHLTLVSDKRGEKTETWQKLFVVGANLGVALPGRYPTEFAATREDYARWLEQMGAAGINVVRAYTILPPEFYQALAEYDFRHTERPVFLLQGIWAEARDVAHVPDLVFLAERAGISDAEVRAAIEDRSWKEKGKANREALTDLGLWGVPSMRIGSYSTWGQDRIPLLEAEIARFSAHG